MGLRVSSRSVAVSIHANGQPVRRDVTHIVGTANLDMIHHPHRSTNLSMAIGHLCCWVPGNGTETARLVLDDFTAPSPHCIRVTAFAYDERGHRAYPRTGFKLVGRWREAVRVGSRPYDVAYPDCLSRGSRGSMLGPHAQHGGIPTPLVERPRGVGLGNFPG